jgi:hypothetical protein
MSVMDMNSRMAMAEKLSVQQLQQAIQSGSLPAYIGIPLIEQKNKEKSQMAAAQQGQEKPPSVASQILQQAEQGGVDQLPSNLPVQGMAGGGIVAFAEGDLVEDRRSPSDRAMDELIARINRSQNNNRTIPPVTNTGEARGGITELFPVDIGVSPEFGGTSSEDPMSFAPGAFSSERRDRVKAERRAEEDRRRQEFLRQSAPQLAAPAAPMEIEDPRLANAPVGIPTAKPRAGAMPPSAGTAQQPTIQATQATQATQTAAQPAQKSALDQYAEMLMAERGEGAKERQQAKGMALLQAGLGIMGGTSPNALANIAQGALPATQAYQSALSNIKKSDRDRLKQLMELGVSKEKLALEAKKLGISERRFDQMYELETQKIGVMGGSRADAAKNAEILRRDQLAFNYFKELLSKNPMATEAEQAAMQDRARVLAGRDSAQAPKDEFAGFSLVPRK